MSSSPGLKSNSSTHWIRTATAMIETGGVSLLTDPLFRPTESTIKVPDLG